MTVENSVLDLKCYYVMSHFHYVNEMAWSLPVLPLAEKKVKVLPDMLQGSLACLKKTIFLKVSPRPHPQMN
jgi:hypothetical protein